MVFKSSGAIRQCLMKMKSLTPEMNKMEVIYQIPCQDCDLVGDTGRTVGKRVTEHQ